MSLTASATASSSGLRTSRSSDGADEVERALERVVEALEDRRARARTAAPTGRARTPRGGRGSPSSRARCAPRRRADGTGRRARPPRCSGNVGVGDDDLVDAVVDDDSADVAGACRARAARCPAAACSETKPMMFTGESPPPASACATSSMCSPVPTSTARRW